MKRLESPSAVIVGCVLIVAANVAMLSTAAWNRSGRPDSAVRLTERELAMPEGRLDQGGDLLLTLHLTQDPPGPVVRVARLRHTDLPAVDFPWLGRAKLADLGFDTSVDPGAPEAGDAYAHASPRRTYLVLEYEGRAWTRWLAGREEEVRQLRERLERGVGEPRELADAEALLALDRTMRSRLMPVDAGTDPDALRARYPDRTRYAVLRGLLRPKVLRPDDGPAVLGGTLDPLVRQVHVPRQLRPQLEGFLPQEPFNSIDLRDRENAVHGWPAATPARYGTTLAVGRLHIPWLTEIAAFGAAGSDAGPEPR